MLSALALVGWAVACGAAPPGPAAPSAVPAQPPPQVVVSVKYGPAGGVDNLLVAQYPLSGAGGEAARLPNNVTRPHQQHDKICEDLCASGLGGLACGHTCSAITPSELISIYTKTHQEDIAEQELAVFEGDPASDIVKEHSDTEHTDPEHTDTEHAGTEENEHKFENAPRVEVCPTLCLNNLGWPLCDCAVAPPNNKLWNKTPEADWPEVCSVFCPLQLEGCPACSADNNHLSMLTYGARILNTNQGWIEWCAIQCPRGDGGAACNCDRAPF